MVNYVWSGSMVSMKMDNARVIEEGSLIPLVLYNV